MYVRRASTIFWRQPTVDGILAITRSGNRHGMSCKQWQSLESKRLRPAIMSADGKTPEASSRSSTSRRRTVLCLLTMLFLFAFILFFTYHKLFISRFSRYIDLSHERAHASSEFSIQLHPEEHIRRAPTTLHYSWNITRGYRSPDGVKKCVYLINGRLALSSHQIVSMG